MANAIREALQQAERIPARGVRKKAVEVSGQIKLGEELESKMLGIESRASAEIKTRLQQMRIEQMSLDNFLKLKTRHHRLSLAPLTWRNKDGWPRLVVFDIGSPTFELSANGTRGRWDDRFRFRTEVKPKLPSAIASCYKDVLARLLNEARKLKKSVQITFQFEGVIPKDVRNRIHEIRKQRLFKNIYVIAEPGRFTVKKTNIKPVVSLKGDPLVVGFDGENLWLIADFDTTTVEEAMIFTDSAK